MATGNAPRGFPRILQWLLAGLMLIIGLAVGYSWGKTGPRRRYTVLRADGRGHGHRGGVDFPQPPRRYSVIRRGVYRLGDLGD